MNKNEACLRSSLLQVTINFLHVVITYFNYYLCFAGNLISVDGVLGGIGLEMVEYMDMKDHGTHEKPPLSPKSNDDSQEE
jgi:hypothetical protein